MKLIDAEDVCHYAWGWAFDEEQTLEGATWKCELRCSNPTEKVLDYYVGTMERPVTCLACLGLGSWQSQFKEETYETTR